MQAGLIDAPGANGFAELLAANGGASLAGLEKGAPAPRIVACRWRQPSHDIHVPPCEDHFLELMLGGAQRNAIRVDNVRVADRVARPGDALFVPAGHEVVCVAECEDAEVLHLMFSPSLLAAGMEDALLGDGPGSPEPRPTPATHQVIQLARMLEEELTSPRPLGSLYADGLSQAFAVAFSTAFLARSPAPPPLNGLTARQLRTVTDYMEAALDGEVRLADVAATIGVTPFHFGRQFKRSTGQTPHQYLPRRRVQRAADLLSGSDMPIAEVAVLCGFHDQPRLSTTLKRVLGVTPGSLRRRSFG